MNDRLSDAYGPEVESVIDARGQCQAASASHHADKLCWRTHERS